MPEAVPDGRAPKPVTRAASSGAIGAGIGHLAFDDLTSPDALELLGKAPTPLPQSG
ncbi:MAG: hypothetical protein ACRDOZ_11080 [Nocardioides sp.]